MTKYEKLPDFEECDFDADWPHLDRSLIEYFRDKKAEGFKGCFKLQIFKEVIDNETKD